MTSQLVNRLNSLASDVGREYGPKLIAAAHLVEHNLEAWTSSVDEWVESHFEPAAEKLRQEAGAAYRAAVTEAHKLIAEVKATL